MKKTNLFVGIFITAAVVLFGLGLFLIGNQHKAFRSHVEFYAEFANIDGVAKGAKVRVDGMDGGEVVSIGIPSNPSEKFRLKLQVDGRLHGLVREDSVVSVETEGVVGDKYLLIQQGSDGAPVAPPKSTLRSKEPFQMAKLLQQASGLLNQANGTMTDVRGRLDGALDAVTKTVNDTNGVVSDLRHGKGAAGMLLEDKATADQVKQTITNTQTATANVDTATVKVNNLLADFQSRDLFGKAQQTLDNANGAAKQLNQTSQQVNQTLTRAFAENQYGQSAGANLQQTLTNVNEATGNLAEDTEALKHEFFFRGFFKKRGYDNLDQLPVTEYRDGTLFKKLQKHRDWFAAGDLFTTDATGKEVLSQAGQEQIKQAFGRLQNAYSEPIVLEGYAESGSGGDRLLESRARAVLVRAYLELQFHVLSSDIGVIALGNQPPASAGKSTWNGVCLVQLSGSK